MTRRNLRLAARKRWSDSKTNELYVADGYGNHRVIVFDADTGAYQAALGAHTAISRTTRTPVPMTRASTLPA